MPISVTIEKPNVQGLKKEPLNSGQLVPQNNSIKNAEDTFKKVKKQYTNILAGVTGVSVLGILAGSLKYGSTLPARVLDVVGDCFGSVSAILAPFSIIGNEIKNYFLLKGKQKENSSEGIFDDWREGFYRTSSLGFVPFIFEPFINPEKFGKSIFHKIATVANIPNLIFTGYSWGYGNFQALLAWVLRKKEQISESTAKQSGNITKAEESRKNAEAYNQLYDGCKRLATIGSIANPTLQGLRQCADSLAFLTGNLSKEEFFEKPFLAVSRVVSLFVGVPETFAKGIDSIVRVIKERENLKPALPGFLKSKKAFDLAEKFEKKLSGNDGTLKSIRHYAEIIFHTLSPLSMFSLFTPLLGESHINEDAQSKGGLAALLNKILGSYGKTLTMVFTGLYVTFARLPQTVFQISYFGKKLLSKIQGKEVTPDNLTILKEKICNLSFVNYISNIAKQTVEKLVPDFYTAEHEHGYLTYEQIQANYSFDQAKEHITFKLLLQAGSKVTAQDKEAIVNYCLEYVRKDASQGRHKLTSKESENITQIIKKKIEHIINPASVPKRQVKLPFIGAEFLATYIFKLFDLKTRLQSIDYRSSHHNMTTAYDNDERRISFEYELLPVVAKCTKGLNNTVNRIFGIAV